MGDAILIMAWHACGHLGGLTVVRAAGGKQRPFVPAKELLGSDEAGVPAASARTANGPADAERSLMIPKRRCAPRPLNAVR